MPKLTIDQRDVEVPAGATVLDAARKAGIEIPTLCHLDGCEPSASCLVCTVKLVGQQRLVPACGTLALDGMRVESETAEVHRARRTALELLLSDHVGDCLAPCQFGCPAHMDIPQMLRQIVAGDLRGAIVTVKRDIAMPAVLGRICTRPCEKACRRAAVDGAVAICDLKRYVADADLADPNPYVPQCQADSGKHVAVVGAGPCGLSAAYYLRQRGHGVTLFDDGAKPGGRLRDESNDAALPQDVLEREIAVILQLGVQFRASTSVGDQPDIEELLRESDAVLIAWGAGGTDRAERWGLATGARGIVVQKDTFQTDRPGVFAAGSAIRENAMVVRSVADGKEAAAAMNQYLSGQEVRGVKRPFSTRIGRMTPEELSQLLPGAADAPRREVLSGWLGHCEAVPQTANNWGFADQGCASVPVSRQPPVAADVPRREVSSEGIALAVEQASRCLHCDCSARDDCRLRIWSACYGADPNRYRGQRRQFQRIGRPGGVIFEPGKCIACGLCVEVARREGAPLGLTFIGRGFDVRVGVPFGRLLDEALGASAERCVAVCPTGALSMDGGAQVSSAS